MIQNLAGSLHQQFIAQIRIQLTARPLALNRVKFQQAHADSPLPSTSPPVPIPNDLATSANSCRSNFRPRLNRDITVPNGTFMVSAISLYEKSSTSAISTTS